MSQQQKFDIRYRGLVDIGYEAKDISNRDLDDMKYSGVFYGFNVISAPDINFMQIIITRHNSSWIVQEAKDYVDRIYLRSFKNNTWSEWELLEQAHDCDQPDKEIIIIERPHTHALATPQNHGFMSADHAAKLEKISIDGEIKPGDHEHPELEEKILEVETKINEVNSLKADKEHEHDERYIPAFSSSQPTNQSVVGQVWIEIN